MESFLLFFFFFSSFFEPLVAQPTVEVNNGYIVGMELTHDGRVIQVYKGIPYAKPPIGELRFKKPEPSLNWEGVLNATKYGPSCTQFSTFPREDVLENPETSEDCLTLNVFAPSNSSESPLAIMVWIHGGGNVVGEAQSYDPRAIVAKGEIIVVTINYRLGPFGFLSTEDENAPGNYAHWDQLLAIQWVKDNAAAFGGDPDRITIFGESAGSWSVSILALSPKSQGVFQRAISQSGAIGDYMLQVNTLDETRAFSELVNCAEQDTSLLVQCLRGVSEEDMVNIGSLFSIWLVVIDGDLLTDLPSKLGNNMASFDYMIGFNELEGFVLSSLLINYTSPTNQGTSAEIFSQNIANIISQFPTLVDSDCQLQKVIEATIFTYTYWDDVENDQERLLNLIAFFGDFYFKIPSIELARLHQSSSGSGSTYLYHFTYKPATTPFSSLFALFNPVWNDKATHGDELLLMFYSNLTQFFDETDRNVSETIIAYWTNFAKTGDPNGLIGTNIPEWMQFGDLGEYIELGKFTLADRDMNDLDPERVNFWLDLIPKLFENSCSTITSEPCTESPEGSESEKNTFTLTAKQSEVVIWVMIALVIIMFLLNLVMCLSYIHRKNLENYIDN